MLKSSGQTAEYFTFDVASLSFVERERIQERDNIIFVEKRRVSMGEYGLFVIGYSWASPSLNQGRIEMGGEVEEKLWDLCKKEKCLFLQIETMNYSQDAVSSLPLGENWEGESREGFTSWYYKKFIPPYTAVINLTQTEEEMLAAMKQKGRYNIRLAEKKGVVIEQVEKNPYNAKIYHELMNLTTTRNNFAGNTQKYYEEFLEKIEDSQLFFAYYEEQVIAAGIFVYHGDTAMYYYGASNNEYRKVMAPHLLQWKAIEHAKKRWCKIYDFLWVAWPDEENSALAGVTKFKMQLTPDRRKVSESYIFVNKKWKYRCIQLLKRIKK